MAVAPAAEPSAPTPETAPSAAATPIAVDPKGVVRARDVIEHPEWAGRVLTIDLYDDLLDSAHSSLPEDGEYGVDVEDVGPERMVLVPGALSRLPGSLAPPLRVVAKVSRNDRGTRLAAVSIQKLTWPAPEKVAAKSLAGHVGRYGRFVQVEGDWLTGFEGSLLEEVWIGGMHNLKVRCKPTHVHEDDGDYTTNRVRVTGMAYGESRHYGHMGAAPATIVATEIVYLGDDGKECKR